ncbi:MAG: TonB-dependent receptor [Gemmatimonadales bacterium]
MFSFPTQFPSQRPVRSVRGLTKLWLITMIACYWVTPLLAEDAIEQLPDVVVSASRVPLPAKEIGSAVTVITGKELEQRQVRVVSDVLRDVPGLAVSRPGPVGAFTQVRIRGAEGNQTLVLIDGIEVNNPAGGSEFNFANVLNAEIARIEVLRGPQSAIYGSDSIGGVINIITKRPEPGLIINGRGEAGSFATREGVLNLGYGSERFYLSGLIDRFATNGVSVADEDNGNSEADSYDNTTGHLKAGVKPFEFLEIDAVGMLVDSDREDDALAPVINIIDSEDESETRRPQWPSGGSR